MPFCSTRCKQIDAKRWLNEEYGLPYETEQNQIENEILNNMYGLEDNE
jgi:endogenous inhibitor of DNA gyrase (YacG/DUF329 family)